MPPANRCRRLGAVVLTLLAAACGNLVEPVTPGTAGSPAVRGLRLDASALALLIGQTRQLTATPVNAAGQPVPVPAGQSVRYISSDASIASVTGAGLVSGVATGTAVVRIELGALVVGVTVTVGGTGTDRLVVVSGTAQTGPPSAELANPIVIEALAADGQPRAGLAVTFAPSAGTVTPTTVNTDGQGRATTRWTLGSAVGAQSLSASAPGFGEVTVAATAVARPVTSITVTPANPQLGDVGQVVQLTARAFDGTGAEVPGVTFTWASSRPDVALVSSTGRVTAVAAGTSTIAASAGTVSGSTIVAVTIPSAPPRLQLTPTSLSGAATTTITSAPRVLGTVELREATGRPVTDLGALTVGTTQYTAGQPTGWVTSAVLGGTGNATLTVTVDAIGLAAGTYNATIPVSAALASNNPVALPVQLVVAAPSVPVIVLTPPLWSPSLALGATTPATQVIAITNGGGGTLNGLSTTASYAAGEAIGWLRATLNGTAAPTSLVLEATAGSLASGTYRATVTVTSSASGVAPATIPVQLTITGGGRLRVFLGSFDFSGAIRNDTLYTSVGSTYGTATSGTAWALADAAGARVRPSAVSPVTYFDGPPAVSWLSATATDTGFSTTVANTPALLANVYDASFTISVPGFTPLVVRQQLGVRPRLVVLADSSDTTSVVTRIDLPLDRGSTRRGPNLLLRQIGGWCQRGTYGFSGVNSAPLASWLFFDFFGSFSLPSERVAQVGFAVLIDQIALGRENSFRLFIEQVLPAGSILDAQCRLAAQPNADVDIVARPPDYRFDVNPDTVVLAVDTSDTFRQVMVGQFDLTLTNRVPSVNACENFSLLRTGVQLLLDPADRADGLDFGPVLPLSPIFSSVTTRGARFQVEVLIDSLRRGRSYRFDVVLFPSFRCPDGVIPVPDTVTVELTPPNAGIAIRPRTGPEFLPLPYALVFQSVNPAGSNSAPAGFPAAYEAVVARSPGLASPQDQIELVNVTYGPGAADWLSVSATPLNVADTVGRILIQLSPGRAQVPRGDYRATVRLRSTFDSATVSFPVTYAVGGTDGQLQYGALSVGEFGGCGTSGSAGANVQTDQLFCWGRVEASLIAATNPAGFYQRLATTTTLTAAPVPQPNDTLPVFGQLSQPPFIRQTASNGANVVMLVQPRNATEVYVTHGGFLAETVPQNINFEERFAGMRLLRFEGNPFRASAVAVSPGVVTAACAVRQDRQPYCWGERNDELQLPGDQDPRLFATPGVVDSVVVGVSHACAWQRLGSVWCWGSNSVGQLGRGTTSSATTQPVAVVPGITGVRSVSIGNFTTCATTGTGIFCWGSNASGLIYGQPRGPSANYPSPVQITAPVLELQTKGGFACGRSSSTPGALFCWGGESSPGGQVRGPTGSGQALPSDYREALWPVSVQDYAVGVNTTCYAESAIWRCSGGDGASNGTNTPGATLRPTELLGQFSRPIGGAGLLTASRRMTSAAGATSSPDLLARAGAWMRGLMRRDVRSTVGRKGQMAARPAPRLVAGPMRSLDGSRVLPPTPAPVRPTYTTIPLEEYLRRPTVSRDAAGGRAGQRSVSPPAFRPGVRVDRRGGALQRSPQ